MTYDGNRLLLVEWVGYILWAVLWGSLGYIAIAEKSITLGGKMSIHHFEGLSAVLAGFVLLGVSLAGLSLLFRLHPLRRLFQLVLLCAWLLSTVLYFAFLYR